MFRNQSNLGSVGPIGRKDLDMQGYTALARVIKVHHKYNTADVMLVDSRDTLAGSSNNEGRFSCRIAAGNAHYDKYTRKSWGEIEPICEEDLVVVAFMGNRKAQPMIIHSFHRMEDCENILPLSYPVYDYKEALKYLRVFPSQNYIRVDGSGDTEITFVGKSFLKIGPDVTDVHGLMDFNDLKEKDSRTGETLSLDEGMEKTDQTAKVYLPEPEIKKYLFVHRSSLDDTDTTWTKLFLDGDGTFRVSRDNNDNKLSSLELLSSGDFSIRRQMDSDILGEGSNFTEVRLLNNGSIVINRTLGDSVFSLVIDENGKLDVIADSISFSSRENPEIKMSLSGSGISLNG